MKTSPVVDGGISGEKSLYLKIHPTSPGSLIKIKDFPISNKSGVQTNIKIKEENPDWNQINRVSFNMSTEY